MQRAWRQGIGYDQSIAKTFGRRESRVRHGKVPGADRMCYKTRHVFRAEPLTGLQDVLVHAGARGYGMAPGDGG